MFKPPRFSTAPESKHVRYAQYKAIGVRDSDQYVILDPDPTVKKLQVDQLKHRLHQGEIKDLIEKTGVCYLRYADRQGFVFHILMDNSITETGRSRFYNSIPFVTEEESMEVAYEYQKSALSKYEAVLEEQKEGWAVGVVLLCGAVLPADYHGNYDYSSTYEDGIYDGDDD